MDEDLNLRVLPAGGSLSGLMVELGLNIFNFWLNPQSVIDPEDPVRSCFPRRAHHHSDVVDEAFEGRGRLPGDLPRAALDPISGDEQTSQN